MDDEGGVGVGSSNLQECVLWSTHQPIYDRVTANDHIEACVCLCGMFLRRTTNSCMFLKKKKVF